MTSFESLTAGLAAALTLTAAVAPASVAAQEDEAGGRQCPQGRISYVFVDNHGVFDIDELRDDASLLWAYELANSLHVTTRRDFLLDELLVGEGGCYDPTLLEESERLVRAYPFIARVDVYGLQQPDGSWHVVVDTKDEWTTKVNVNVALEEGFEFRGVSLTEENLAGRGYLVGLFFRQREEEQDLGARLFTPRIFGTRLDVGMEAGRTRSGTFFAQELFYPFVGEVGRFAFREVLVRRDELFAYALGGGSAGRHLLMPVNESRTEVSVAGRLGHPGNLTVLGLGISHETLDFPDFPGSLELTIDGDFDDTEPASPEQAERVREHTVHAGGTRFNLLFGQRNIRFVQREGLDALRGVQDVEVGTDIGLTLGRSVAGLTTSDEEPDDLYVRGRLFGGMAPGTVTANLVASVEARHVFAAGARGDGWRDVLAELDALLYWQPAAFPGHTLFARVAAAGGWNTTLPFQLTLGGAAGVRGFDRDAFPGGGRLVLTLEDRIYVPWPFPDLVDLGFTAFVDGGRTWSNDAPFGEDPGWKVSVGAGLRIGFPAETRGVVRIDVAQPIESGADFEDLVLRVSLLDLPGLAGGFRDPQVERSRRVHVGPDAFTRIRR